MQPILEVLNLSVRFETHEGVVNAVNGLSYIVNAEKTLGIVGESGSGKSVSSLAVMDLLPKPPAVIDAKSSMKVLGQEVVGLSKRDILKLRGETVAMIFQDPMTSLNPYRRVDSQMIEGLKFHKNVSTKEALKKAETMLDYVLIPDAAARLRSYPHELSGGMRQRVMIAMSLMRDPRLLFADEPTTALDVTVQAQIMDLFQNIKNNFKTAIVMISHNLGVIATQCDEILVMYGGSMMEFGTPEDIFENSQHPYTIALKRSIPELYPKVGESQKLSAIKGNPPNLMNLPVGCPFAARCEHVTEKCRQGIIPVKKISETHSVRCLL